MKKTVPQKSDQDLVVDKVVFLLVVDLRQVASKFLTLCVAFCVVHFFTWRQVVVVVLVSGAWGQQVSCYVLSSYKMYIIKEGTAEFPDFDECFHF